MLFFFIIFQRVSYSTKNYLHLPDYITRTWIGPDFWANRLQDWRINIGRIECIQDNPEKPMRTVHLLTYCLGKESEGFELSTRTGILGFNYTDEGNSWTGFLIGAGNNGIYPESAALIHHSSGTGGGLIACLQEDGQLAFRNNESEASNQFLALKPTSIKGAPLNRNNRSANWEDIILKLKAVPMDNGNYRLILTAIDFYSQRLISEITYDNFPGQKLIGNMALVSHGGKTGTRYWFRDFSLSGKKIKHFPNRNFGPVMNAFYSLNQGKLKLSAQFPPLGFGDNSEVSLYTKKTGDDQWLMQGQANINPKGWLALFEINNWQSDLEHDYQIRYQLHRKEYIYEGVIKREPVSVQELSVAAFTCYQNIARPADDSWGVGFAGQAEGRWTKENLWFPHKPLINYLHDSQPDLLVFLGDQVYEGGNPTDSEPIEGNPTLDFFYKYFIFLWEFRDITRNTPAILLTDDHDVYQGDLWGASGEPSPYGSNKAGGYVNEPQFVNIAEHVMTAHNPDLYNPTPIKQNIGVYYGSFVYGGVSFAILEDRKFKSLPTIVGDVEKYGSKIVEKDYDPLQADVPGATLLGERQLNFLEEWVQDWNGASMKLAISQTLYAALHTAPDGTKWKDIDANGWPQSGRNKALEILRKGQVTLIGGDTHLPVVVQHGINEFADASYQFVVPAVSNKYRRWWSPGKPDLTSDPSFFGNHLDGLANKVTIHALGNPEISNQEVYDLNQELGKGYASEHIFLDDQYTKDGFGLIRFDKLANTITFESWSAHPDQQGKWYQHEGWPVSIRPAENDRRKVAGYLPEFAFSADKKPVVKVFDQESNELISAFRVMNQSIKPKVYKESLYKVVIELPESGQRMQYQNLSIDDNHKKYQVNFQ